MSWTASSRDNSSTATLGRDVRPSTSQRTSSSAINRIVGRTHTIVRFQTRIRRKDGTENFGGFVYVLDGFPQRDFVLWVLMCPINISLFCLFWVSFVFSLLSFPATTPRATTPHLYRTGYHAQGYHAFTTTARLPRLCIYIYIPATTP